MRTKDPKTQELKNQLARALADYDNLRKRTEIEKEETQKFINSITIQKLIPVMDSLLDLERHNEDQGLELVIKNFKSVLEDLGAEEVQVKEGEEFDPLYHEVSEVVETDDKSLQNKIAGVVMTGWKLKDEDFVIRPVKVKVYKLKE